MKLKKYEIYVPYKSYRLKILPNKEMLNFKHICEDIKVTYTDGLSATEFCDIMNFTKSYKEIRDGWFDRNASYRDIFEEIEQQLFKLSNKISESQYDALSKHYSNLEAKDLDLEIARNVFIAKISISSVAIQHKVSISYVRKVVARFKSNLKKKNLWNRKFLNKKKKITQDLIENIRDYWKLNDGKIYTLNDVKLFIDKKYFIQRLRLNFNKLKNIEMKAGDEL